MNDYREAKDGYIGYDYRDARDGYIGYNYRDGYIGYDDSLSPAHNASKQIGGTHYSKHMIQPWDIIDEYGLDYHRGNAIKYILRNKMDTIEDIEKAVHYLEHWLEINANV